MENPSDVDKTVDGTVDAPEDKAAMYKMQKIQKISVSTHTPTNEKPISFMDPRHPNQNKRSLYDIVSVRNAADSELFASSKRLLEKTKEKYLECGAARANDLLMGVLFNRRLSHVERKNMTAELFVELGVLEGTLEIDPEMIDNPRDSKRLFSMEIVERRRSISALDLMKSFSAMTTAICGVRESTVDLLRHVGIKAVLVSRKVMPKNPLYKESCRIVDPPVCTTGIAVYTPGSNSCMATRIFYKHDQGDAESNNSSDGLMTVVTPADGEMVVCSVVNISTDEKDPEEAAFQQCYDVHTKLREKLLCMAFMSLNNCSPKSMMDAYMTRTMCGPLYYSSNCLDYYFELEEKSEAEILDRLGRQLRNIDLLMKVPNLFSSFGHSASLLLAKRTLAGAAKYYLVIRSSVSPKYYGTQSINWFNVIRTHTSPLRCGWVSETVTKSDYTSRNRQIYCKEMVPMTVFEQTDRPPSCDYDVTLKFFPSLELGKYTPVVCGTHKENPREYKVKEHVWTMHLHPEDLE